MTPRDQQQATDHLARTRLIGFVMLVFEHLHPGDPPLRPAWYLKAMCWWLEKVSRGQILRSMIWIMPRTLKSITVAVAFPCWLLGQKPSSRIMIVTYADSLSLQHADQRRQILDSLWYRRIFPGVQVRTSRQHEIRTDDEGQVLAVSVMGTITGRGADVIILDDSMRGGDQDSQIKRDALKSWFTNTLVTRLNDKRTGAIVSIQQRLHEEDLPAFMLERGFECLRLPAIADRDVEVEIGPNMTHLFKRGELLEPVRFGPEVLDKERLMMGNRDYSAQYLQDPVAAEGNLLCMEHFRRFERPIAIDMFERIFQSWDTAASTEPTADWSVCTTWGWLAGRIFLLHIYRARVDLPTLRNMAITLHRKWKPNHVIIEHASSGIGLIQELKRVQAFPVAKGQPSTGKAERLIAQTGLIEEGRVWLPAQLDGLDAFLSELRAFPNGRYYDQVDSMTQALEFVNRKWRLLAQEYTPTGRSIHNLRHGRPPLPPLPSFIR